MPKGYRKDGTKLGFQKGNQFAKGNPPNNTSFKKGHPAPKTAFKKGQPPEKTGHWKGGKIKREGYIFIHQPNHPFCNNQSYIQEHRLVIEKQIGRYLKSKEESHHLNEIRDDNRPKNLMAFTSKSAHQRFHKNPNNVKPNEIVFDGRHLPLLLNEPIYPGNVVMSGK